jgi:radical SAM superfamily enzyme YgiQ (UPF0313 family)
MTTGPAASSAALRVKFVSMEQGIGAFGFRRVAAVARRLHPATGIYFITTGNLYSLATHIFPSRQQGWTEGQLRAMAGELAACDLLCISSMTPVAAEVEVLIAAVKKSNPKVFILWGGTHSIIYPDDAITHVDAICTGEGETPFTQFFTAFVAQGDFSQTSGMWFNTPKGVQKNPHAPLTEGTALASFPHMYVGLDCQIFDHQHSRFRAFTPRDYAAFNGLSYRTIWSLGCPYSCIYCANSAFIANDPQYRKIRYSPVAHLLEELEQARKLYPFISTVAFYDDNFISIPLEVLKDFSTQYRQRIGLPFVVFGLHPNAITEEKLALLAEAGMNRGRMGIQSGNERMLEFYNRKTPLRNVKRSADLLARAAIKYRMIPPAYDIISDNPLETREDVMQTLEFLYTLERPYTLTLFSLRVFPQTQLWDYFEKNQECDIRALSSSYLETRKSMANILLYLLATLRPPRFLFNWMLRSVRGYQEPQKSYPLLHLLVKVIYLASRGMAHLLKLDFTTISGGYLYTLWKLGIVRNQSKVK